MTTTTENNTNGAPARRAKLSPEKQALLAQRLRANEANQLPQITRRDKTSLPPLSFVQESLWLQNQLEPEGVTYQLPAAIRLRGTLHVEALEWSVNEIIKRHEALRTNFKMVHGQAVQIISPSLTITIPIIDLQTLSANEQADQIQKLIAAESACPFDLSLDVLLRLQLLRLNDSEHIVLFTTHHIISDGWSRMVFIQELVKFYEIYLQGQRGSLPQLPIQYADFSQWQRDQFHQGAFDKQLNYWKQQLNHAPFILELPTDQPRSAHRTFNGTKKLFEIPLALSTALKNLCQQTSTTPFMAYMAVFQSLLYRYTSQEDFLVGSPIANRQHSELEGLIGFFANTIVLRAQLSGETRYCDLLQQVKQTALSAYANQDVVFEKIVELVQPTRSSTYSPLFQVMFAYQSQSIEEINLSELSLSLLTEDSDAAKFDLSLSINENKNQLFGKLEYNSDLFSATTIDRMIAHFLMLLDGILSDPTQVIAHLPLLTEQESLQLSQYAQPALMVDADDLTIHERFAAQAVKTPDSIAVVDATTSLTYQQLNAKADQIAHHLQKLGVKPDTLVGVCVERSVEMMVALLGILKSGAAYLPLDPHYPASRLAYMIQDSQIEFVLSQKPLSAKIANNAITVLAITDIIAASTEQNVPVNKSQTSHLAYAIYTSGSTGKPKGVMVEHRNVTSFMNAMDKQLGTTPGTWLAQTSLSFDISVLELLWTLTRGYKVVLANNQLVSTQPVYVNRTKPIAFSLFYFASSAEGQASSQYKLLLEGTRFADEHGFTAIWTPERHFATFGGLYPNPAIASAALAAMTKRIGIRAGSCVLPLHNPIRVAEDWALVDNLSDGRVGISFASGWQPNDFVLAPENYTERNKIMIEGISKVQALLRGEGVSFVNGIGQEVEVHTLPRPVQEKLPMWLTASGNPETFRQAGALGLNLLTHLLGQSPEELAEKIKLYRQSWHEHGHGPVEGHVTLMLHTFIGEDEQVVFDRVKQPLKNYLRDSIGLLKPFSDAMGLNLQQASPEDMDAVLEHAFARYYKTSGLFGTVESCQLFVDQLKGIGVDEIACLIDFGIETDTVLQSLHHLNELRQVTQPLAGETAASNLIDDISALIKTNKVTHFQCTPSMAGLLQNDANAIAALASIDCFLVGGESLPLSLAQSLTKQLKATVFNMYGPTETTIWSTSHRITPDVDRVSIGKPLANTKIFILDQHQKQVPVGMPGELYIGGSGVVRGYLHRPELTDERFIDLEIEPGKPQRLYRTGDRARYLPDGTLLHLGRVDMQVKIRGFRVELGEIEKVIATFPDIQEVVVTLQTENTVAPYLVAYLIWQQHTTEKLNALRAHLKTELPDYMIPAVFMQLQALPLTPNGKIDRKALPAVDTDQLPQEQEYVAPSTAMEIAIAPLWIATMGRETIGVHDNFFELGGHSLLAADLATKIERATGKRLPLHQFFEHPTIAGIASFLEMSRDQLSEDMLLPMVLPDPANKNQPFPLTDVQQAYLIGRSGAFELGNISTHGYVELDFTDLQLQQLTMAWNQLITRHDMLRMVINDDNQQQILADVPYYSISQQDVSQLSMAEAQRHMQDYRKEMSHQVLPADQWPLFDLRVTKISDQHFRLHVSLDTLIADGWSADILFKEFYAFYTGIELPTLSLSFRDYVIAERKIKTTNLYQRARDYWLNRISTLPLGPKLPLAKDPSQIDRPIFTRRQKILDLQQWQSLKRKAQKSGITPSVLLLTAYAETLGQWSKESRFCLNLTLFHRLPLHAQVDQIIGDFTSLTLLEIDLQSGQSFTERSHTVQKQLWSDLEHKYFSGVEVVREIARHHNNQRMAAVPVVFTSTLDADNTEQNAQQTALQQLGKEVFVITQTPQVWLDHQVVERDGNLHLTWDAVEELFEPAVLDDMFNCYCNLLQHLAEETDVWHQPYRNLTPQYQLAQRKAVNNTQETIPTVLIHELFINQVKRDANALAVIAPEIRLSYGDLQIMAHAVAQQLQEYGTERNQLVAVVMEKGWEQVVAVLAILMAGSAYLPIDATLPQERIEQLLAIGGVKIALRQADKLASFNWPATIKTLIINSELLKMPVQSPLPSVQSADDLAYVIFTSGSTGQPKGVMIDHQGAVNTLLDINQRYQVCANDKVLALSSLSFDLSVYDIFGVLAAGGTIVFPKADLVKDPKHWLELIATENISLWNTVPMFFQMLVEYCEHKNAAIPQNLRLALMSGDYIPVSLPPRAHRLFPNLTLISLGGATEASIWSIYYPIADVDHKWKSIPYGKPLKNQTMHVLKADLTCSPLWVPGDLYIGGMGLAKGYWQDAEKTANSFMTNPHTGERLYKTGDLGRYLPDGQIEFLGREDHQVKIQGYRVELGEIENAIVQHEAIEQAVVVAVSTDETNIKRLVAYVVISAKVMERYSENYRSKEMAFKLRQRGIRALQPQQALIQLPHTQADQPLTLTHFTSEYGQAKSMTMQDLSELLHCLRQIKTENMLLPKYHYPSAGSLYPVQTYLKISSTHIHGLPAGIYYYHPVQHALVFILPVEELAQTETMRMDLIAYLPAITPLYPDLADDFCLLEAGYMSQLLAAQALSLNIGFYPVECNVPEDVMASYNLDNEYRFLQAFELGARKKQIQPLKQSLDLSVVGDENIKLPYITMTTPVTRHYLQLQSFRQFSQSPIELSDISFVLNCLNPLCMENHLSQQFGQLLGDQIGHLKIVLHLKPNVITTLESGGIYTYEMQSHSLIWCNTADAINETMHTAHNQPIFSAAGFSIFLLLDNQGNTLDRDAFLLLTGALGQILMDVAPQKLIGICPIGSLDNQRLLSALNLNDHYLFIHSFIGGKIEPEQLQQLPQHPRETKNGSPAELLQNYLANKLPQYMVPGIYIPLTSLPQNVNGKIDRAALPNVTLNENHNQNFIAPETPLEKQIAEIWLELLNISKLSVLDNFFELGGNSLLILQMQRKLQSALHIEIALVDLFVHTNVRALAQFLKVDGPTHNTVATSTKRAEMRRQAARGQTHLKEKTNA